VTFVRRIEYLEVYLASQAAGSFFKATLARSVAYSGVLLSIGVGYTIVTGGSIEVELLYNLIDKSIRSGSL